MVVCNKMRSLNYLFFSFYFTRTEALLTTESTPFNGSRRILQGHKVFETRPYMVYLRPALVNDPSKIIDPNWLCGGVIVHPLHILTSAACIEDSKHFYVISGTHKWVPFDKTNDCITNGARKAVWKCVPKTYTYDGHQFNNIRWIVDDVAVVRVDEEFNFNYRVRGCDFIPKMVAFNNKSEDMEAPGTIGSIAGWGSPDKFVDMFVKMDDRKTLKLNSPELMETDVVIISKKNCKKRWSERYHYIIDGNVICTKDISVSVDDCTTNEAQCKEIIYSDETKDDDVRRVLVHKDMDIHTAGQDLDLRRSGNKIISGGFCENDHGGPLIVGQGTGATVIGIMSACQTREGSMHCYGPFLYTSIFKNRNMINCAIYRDAGRRRMCSSFFRSGVKSEIRETKYDWANVPETRTKLAIKVVEKRTGETHEPETKMKDVKPRLISILRKPHSKTNSTKSFSKKPGKKIGRGPM